MYFNFMVLYELKKKKCPDPMAQVALLEAWMVGLCPLVAQVRFFK